MYGEDTEVEDIPIVEFRYKTDNVYTCQIVSAIDGIIISLLLNKETIESGFYKLVSNGLLPLDYFS